MRIKAGTGASFHNPNDWSDSKHTYRDYGLILRSKDAPFPEPRTFSVDVPNRDGAIDLTEALGDKFIRYQNRTVTLELTDMNFQEHFNGVLSRLARDIHGKHLYMVLDIDPGYYYDGRWRLESVNQEGLIGTVTITGDCYPYKWSTSKNSEPWKWDPFNFETGIVTNDGSYRISGTTKVSLDIGDKALSPVFICTASMTLKVGGETFSLSIGRNQNYGILLTPGVNELTFTGNGTVTIEFRRGAF